MYEFATRDIALISVFGQKYTRSCRARENTWNNEISSLNDDTECDEKNTTTGECYDTRILSYQRVQNCTYSNSRSAPSRSHTSPRTYVPRVRTTVTNNLNIGYNKHINKD